jgi:hypothetical protein
MTRLDIPGGQYVEALPGGEYAALIARNGVQTHAGVVPLPGMDVLQLRIAPDGRRFAGIGHMDDACWEYDHGWVRRAPLAFGPNSVIYDAAGHLRVHSNPALGPIGYRYVDANGNIVTGEATYADASRRIYEWTCHGEIIIGQGGAGPHGEDPVIALYDGERYVLASGQCRFIRFNRSGDNLALGFWQQDQNRAVILWLSVAELASFPQQQTAAPVPNPGTPVPTPGTPPPPPAPTPEPVVSIPNYFDIVRRVNAEHPHLVQQNTRESCAEFMWRVVWALHQHDPKVGFLGKSSSENHIVIAGERVSIDAIAYFGVEPVVDILSSAGDGPGTGGIGWSVEPHRRASNQWVQPVAFPGSSPPAPTPPPPSDELLALQQELASLRRMVMTAIGDALGAKAAVEALNTEVAALKRRPVRVTGSTSRAFGHAHSIDIEVGE